MTVVGDMACDEISWLVVPWRVSLHGLRSPSTRARDDMTNTWILMRALYEMEVCALVMGLEEGSVQAILGDCELFYSDKVAGFEEFAK